MSKIKDLTDEEFVPFLHSLGVETYNKSFEWMLSDPTFSGVLSWLYNNLDYKNVLTPREEYRFAELQKNNHLLTPEDLESTLSTIQHDYPGICLPGDQEALEDAKLDITMQKEKLHMLEKHEKVLQDLIKQNKQVKEQLSIENIKLNSAHQQYSEDESAAASECLKLAEEVETLTDGVVDSIAKALDVYGNCHVDKDISKKFIFFGPLDAYRQSQALYRSHFDLYTARWFGKRQNDSFTEDVFSALSEARNLEKRLSEAAYAYIDSKAKLSGEQVKLDLVSNFNNGHLSQTTLSTLEAQSEIQLLKQEEVILDQQLQAAVKELASSRTRLAVDTATRMDLAVREKMHTNVSHLLETSQQALTLDRLLYYALRQELRTVEECAEFATQLQEYLQCETQASRSRIESMSQIISDQESSTHRLPQTDILLHTIRSLLGAPSDDAAVLVRMFSDLKNKVSELKEDIKTGYEKKEEQLEAFKTSIRPLKDYVFDGCTRQPRGADRTVTSLTCDLERGLDRIETTVRDLTEEVAEAKKDEKKKKKERKGLQWFLTETPIAAVKGVPPRP